MSDWEKYLSSIYFDSRHPASYAGPEKVYKAVVKDGRFKIGRDKIKRWVQNQEAYSLTRMARRKFRRSRVIVNGIDSQWDIDLMDMVSLAKQNDNYKYVLVAIDVFSRFAFCQPVRSKSGNDVKEALQHILEGPRRPNMIRSDRGMEFRSKIVNTYLKDKDIYHFYALNTEVKSGYAERCIKTIKLKLFRSLLKRNTKRYIDILQDTVYSYNHTVHRSLGAAPVSISRRNEGESRLQQYMIRNKTLQPIKPFKYENGQTVRVSHVKSVFDREYSQKWTGELFTVQDRFKRDGIPVYTLKDWSGEAIEGTFYESELQVVEVDDSTEYRVEHVLKKRTRNKVKEVLVRWLHWPSKYDSWIPERDLTHYS